MKKKRVELQRRCTVGRSTKKGIHVVRQGVVPRSTQQTKKEEKKKGASGLEQVTQKRGRGTDHTDGARSPANKGKNKRKKQANHSTSEIHGTVADGNDEATQLNSGPFILPGQDATNTTGTREAESLRVNNSQAHGAQFPRDSDSQEYDAALQAVMNIF